MRKMFLLLTVTAAFAVAPLLGADKTPNVSATVITVMIPPSTAVQLVPCTAPVAAAVAAPQSPVPVPNPTVAVPSFFWNHFDTVVWAVISLLGLFGIPTLIKKLWTSKLGLSADSFEIVKSSVAEVMNEYVNDLKAKNVDGKLTKEQVVAATKQAKDKALAKAKAVGIPLAEEIIPSLIEKALGSLKKDQANPAAPAA